MCACVYVYSCVCAVGTTKLQELYKDSVFLCEGPDDLHDPDHDPNNPSHFFLPYPAPPRNKPNNPDNAPDDPLAHHHLSAQERERERSVSIAPTNRNSVESPREEFSDPCPHPHPLSPVAIATTAHSDNNPGNPDVEAAIMLPRAGGNRGIGEDDPFSCGGIGERMKGILNHLPHDADNPNNPNVLNNNNRLYGSVEEQRESYLHRQQILAAHNLRNY